MSLNKAQQEWQSLLAEYVLVSNLIESSRASTNTTTASQPYVVSTVTTAPLDTTYPHAALLNRFPGATDVALPMPNENKKHNSTRMYTAHGYINYPVTAEQGLRYARLIYGPVQPQYPTGSTIYFDCVNCGCALRVRLTKTDNPTLHTERPWFDFSVPDQRSRAWANFKHPKAPFHTAPVCLPLNTSGGISHSLRWNEHRGLDDIVQQRLDKLVQLSRMFAKYSIRPVPPSTLMLWIGRGEMIRDQVLNDCKAIANVKSHKMEEQYALMVDDLIALSTKDMYTHRKIVEAVTNYLNYNTQVKNGPSLSTAEAKGNAVGTRQLHLPHDLVGQFYDSVRDMTRALNLNNEADLDQGYTIQVAESVWEQFREIGRSRNGAANWTQKDWDDARSTIMFMGMNQLFLLQDLLSQKVKYWYIDGTHGLDINRAAKWVIIFASACGIDPDHGCEYRTSGIPMSFSRGSESLAVAVLSFLVLQYLCVRVFGQDLELDYIGSDRANAFVSAGRLVFKNSINLQCYFHLKQQLQPGRGCYLKMNLTCCPHFAQRAKEDIHALHRCSNQTLPSILLAVIIGWVHEFGQLDFSRYFLVQYGQTNRMRFNYAATGQPGLYPSGNFAERCNLMLKGSRSNSGIVASNVSMRALLQEGGSLDKATQWANQRCQPLGIQWSPSPDHASLSNLCVAILIQERDCIMTENNLEWLVSTPSHLGEGINVKMYEHSLQGNIAQFIKLNNGYQPPCTEGGDQALYTQYGDQASERDKKRKQDSEMLPSDQQNFFHLGGDIDYLAKSIWSQAMSFPARRTWHGLVGSFSTTTESSPPPSAKALYESAKQVVAMQNSVCRVRRQFNLQTGQTMYIGDCETCFKHIQCPACVYVMSILGICNIHKKCDEIQRRRPRSAMVPDYSGLSRGEQTIAHFFHASSKPSLRACVQIPAVRQKLKKETYWAYTKSRNGNVGISDEMKREVAMACTAYYCEQKKQQT
jgi:hypothetical protein